MKKRKLNQHKEPNNIKTNNILCTIIDSKELESKCYSDQTGRFLVEQITSPRKELHDGAGVQIQTYV